MIVEILYNKQIQHDYPLLLLLTMLCKTSSIWKHEVKCLARISASLALTLDIIARNIK